MIKEIAQRMLKKASDFGASDIYILPSRTGFSVVFRKSAHREYDQLLSDAEGQSLISHFKFTAGMNVGEKRRPQLGSCLYELADRKCRLRLSSAGDFESRESLVIRILHDTKQPLKFWIEADLPQVKKLVASRSRGSPFKLNFSR